MLRQRTLGLAPDWICAGKQKLKRACDFYSYASSLASGRTLTFVQWSCGLDVSRSGLDVS